AIWLPSVLSGPFAGAVIGPKDRWACSALALALFVFGYSLRRGTVLFGIMALAFLTGGAAQLYVTEPLWFPTLHLKPQNGREWLMAAIMGAEALVAVWALWRLDLLKLWSEAASRLGTGRILVFLVLTFAFSVPILNYVWRGAAVAYFAHVAAGSILILAHLALLIAMSQVPSPVSAQHRIVPLVPAVFAVLASLALTLFAFDRLPHVEDEVAYLFQARTFASGALTLPAPPEAAQSGLEYYLLTITDGRWYSATLPGWPAFLALGAVLGLPWLINPLLAGVAVMLSYAIARHKIGRDQADLVALMTASSPWFLAAGGSLMPHMFTLVLMLGAWWLILRAPIGGKRTVRRLFLAGLAMGWIFASRPLDGVVIGGTTGLWLLLGAGAGHRITRILPYTAGAVVTGGLLLLYNYQITGSPLTLPLSAYLDAHWAQGANAYGFGPEIGPPGGWQMLDLWVGHSALEAVLNVANLTVSLQLELLGWSIGSLALIFAFFLWQKDKSGFDLAMVIVIFVVVLSMALYWFADSYYFGPRYWFLAVFPFLYLSARGYDALRRLFPGENEQGIVRIDSILGLCCLFGLLVFTPWRGVVKYHEYGNFHAAYRQDTEDGRFGNKVVILSETGDEGSAFVLNDPWLSDPDKPIFLHDSGNLDDAALAAAFPGREVLRYKSDWTRRDPPK
ncbi:MAG: glycosyltransferase family 39 protein, partial [Albidovulum sp.]